MRKNIEILHNSKNYMHRFFNILLIVLFIQPSPAWSQCPDAFFTVNKDSYCQNESVVISNSSVNADKYYWDFCSDDIFAIPNATIIQNLVSGSQPMDIQIIEDGSSWYGFIANRGTGDLFRLDFGENLSNPSPTINNLGNFSGELSLIEDLEIVSHEGKWFALITQNSFPPNNDIIILDFGSTIENTNPSISSLGNFGISTKIRGITVGIDDGDIILFITKSDRRLSLVNFGSSFYNILDSDDIINTGNIATNTLFDIGIFEKCGQWYGAGPATGNLSIFNFGTNLFSTPSVTNLPITSISNSAFDVDFFQNGDSTIVAIGNLSTSYTLINLGQIGNNDTPLILDPDPLSNPVLTGLSINSFEGSIIITGISLGRDLYRIAYTADCSQSINFSNEETPQELSFASSGTYKITLRSFNSRSEFDLYSKKITVTNDVAPNISTSISSDDRCVGSVLNFVASSPDNIVSWNWSFGNGDTSSNQNPSYTFLNAGIYEIVLTAESSNGCTNQETRTIEIYEPQPVTFTNSAQGAICSQKPILFENTTDLPEIATYDWSFGDGSTSTVENPEHVYQNSGEYTVGLTVFFAGCESYAEQTITVNPGPAVSFSTNDNCLGQIVSFENNSSGEFITSYLWDFGDGTTSTQENPEYAFETAGTQIIELTAFTSNGCDFTIQQEIEVYPVAVVDFTNDIACATQPVQFNEEVFLELSNVTNYLWDFGIAGNNTDISTEANPQFSFPEPGIYQVSLQVTTADGCVSEGQKSVTVEAIPEASFSYEPQCVGSTINFVGNANENISTNFWELQNNLGEVLAVGNQGDFSYTFNNSGIYRLRYRQQNIQLCSNEYEEMIEILSNPAPSFTFSQSCAGQPIVFQNITELFGNLVESYSWSIGEEASLNSENPEYTFEEPGTYEVTLEVNTVTGCTETFTQSIEVKPLPDVAFTLEQTVGAYPFQVNATVTEQADFVYQWTINGMIVSEEANLEETLQEAGNYIIALSATNSEGCTNTFSQQVRVRVPEMDIALGNLRVVPQGDVTGFVLTMTNIGSLIPDFIDLDVDLGKFSITERVDRVISPETSVNYVMRLNLTESQLRGLSKICLNAKVVSSVFVEEKTNNNRACTNLEDAFRVLDIYPNPARSSITVPVIIPNSGDVMVVIEQGDGKQTHSLRFELSAGYNEVKIDRASLKSGIYFIRFRFEGIEKVKKVVFQ